LLSLPLFLSLYLPLFLSLTHTNPSRFVSAIPHRYDCTEEDISEALKVCGPVKDVRLARWGHTNALKGFCYVDFKREDSCDIAVKKSGVLNIKGRPLVIDFETGVAKQGYKAGKR